MPDRSTKCFYKQCRTIEAVLTEAQMLELGRSFAASDGTVVIPAVIGIDRSQNLILIQQLAAQDNLFNYLWNQWRRPSYWFQKRLDPVKSGFALGEWLRQFHVSQSDFAESHLDKFTNGILGRLRAVDAKSKGLIGTYGRNRVESIIQLVEKQSATNDRLAVARIHGDLNLSNLLVLTDGRLSVIDFADSRAGIGLEDFAVVYHNVWLTGVCRRHCRAKVAAFLAAFTEGYQLRMSVDDPALKLFRIGAALVQMLSTLSVGDRRNHARRFFDRNRRWIAEL